MPTSTVTARPLAPFHAPAAPPSNYTPVPQRLITDLHDTPLAIGLYALVGRLFLIVQAPLALSVPDLMRYDPTLSRGALIRAFNRLLGGGWLIETKQRGHKTRYLPTWGRVRGIAIPWRMDVPCMGRPRHIRRLPLDRALLDICMGKLTPHPVQTAPITRYVTRPVLSLTDVGCYALTRAGLPRETPALCWIGAVRDGHAYPLPAEARLLALLSQRTLTLDNREGWECDAELTVSGTRRLGLAPLSAPADASARAQPLFFVPPGMIGSMIQPMIGSMIGQDAENGAGQTTQASAETRSAARSAGITWESRDQSESANPPLIPPQPGKDGGGADLQYAREVRPARKARGADVQERQVARTVPDTEATRALTTINVLPEQLIELAEMPIDAVHAAIADGKAREGVRDMAGWVVKILRNHRAYGWKITPPSPRADAPEALRAAFARYGAEQAAELEAAVDAGLSEQLEEATAGERDGATAGERDGELMRRWNDVQAALRMQMARQEFNAWLRPARLHAIERGVATIAVPNVLAKEAIESRYLAALRDLLRACAGEAVEVRVILCPSTVPNGAGSAARSMPPVPAKKAEVAAVPSNEQATTRDPGRRPAWIRTDHWQALPAMLRAALLDSTFVDGAVQAKSAYLNRLLETHFARELGELLALCRTPG